jgi:hypothetical protein
MYEYSKLSMYGIDSGPILRGQAYVDFILDKLITLCSSSFLERLLDKAEYHGTSNAYSVSSEYYIRR